jgi:RNA polymerase sigma-70 factor (ECF subfamily)
VEIQADMNDREEKRIIECVRKGNHRDYALLVDRYKVPLFNLAYRMTGNYDDAEDLAQETFVKAFENLDHFDNNRRFFTWLYTIGLNLIRNHLKKESRIVACYPPEDSLERVEENGTGNNPERHVMDKEDINILNLSLLRLPDDLREAIILRFQQGLSFNDIAEVSGISPSAAKMRVYRGLERLRGLVRQKGVRSCFLTFLTRFY